MLLQLLPAIMLDEETTALLFGIYWMDLYRLSSDTIQLIELLGNNGSLLVPRH